MLTSHFIRAYAHKVASHFDYLIWLRFLILVALTAMSLSEGFSQVLIDVPVDQLINFRALINTGYSLDEIGAVNVVWSNPTLFESIALKGIGSTIDIGSMPFPNSRNVEGTSVGTLIFSSYHNPVLPKKEKAQPGLIIISPLGACMSQPDI